MEKKLTEKAQNTRVKITEIASKLFVEKGYAATTLREIAKDSGLTTGAIYKYYGSKEEILITVYNGIFNKHWGMIFTLKEDCSPEEYARLEGEMNRKLAEELGTELLGIYFTAQWSMTENSSLLSTIDTQHMEAFDYEIINAMIQGFGSDYTNDQVYDIIMRIERGVFIDWIMKKGEVDIEKNTYDMLMLVFGSIFRKLS